MAHQFSVEIHDFLTSTIDAARRELAELTGPADGERASYLSGRLEELELLRVLISKYDLRFHKYFE